MSDTPGVLSKTLVLSLISTAISMKSVSSKKQGRSLPRVALPSAWGKSSLYYPRTLLTS